MEKEEVRQTRGQKIVRQDFNPGQSIEVSDIKDLAAKMIDYLDRLNPDGVEDPAEFGRLKALAITNLEVAAMWAVKAVTCKGFPSASKGRKT